MINNYLKVLAIVSFCSLAFSASEKTDEQDSNYYPSYFGLDRDGQVRGGIGQFGFPSNPMNDRAKGYLLNGVIKHAVSNYGNFITWDEHPAGLWGEYSYLPHVGMIAGVPGQKYSYKFTWYQVSSADIASMPSEFESAPSNWDEELSSGYCEDEGLCSWETDQIAVFCSEDAFDAWSPDSEGLGGEFVDVVFDSENDRGILG